MSSDPQRDPPSEPDGPDVTRPTVDERTDSTGRTGSDNSGGGEQGAESLVGAVLGGTWRLVSVIGAGSMGVVYEAVHTRLNTRFAVKILGRASLERDLGLERFGREAQAASSIEHDNIVQVLDFKVAPSGQPYIVMELLDGKSLRAALAECERFPVARACHVVEQILDALAATHERGIVHRDLKPANIFLTSKFGRDDVVKVLDFGVSKLVDDSLLSTGEGALLGTPGYMAPEQIRTGRTVDQRADLYAVGVVLFELLTGERPFVGRRIESLLYQVLEDPPPSPASMVPGLPDRLDALILRALEKDPSKRFQTAREMLDELRLATHPSEVLASEPKGRPGSIIRTRTSHPGLALGLLGLVVVVLAAWFVLRLLARSPASVPTTEGSTAAAASSATPPQAQLARSVAVLPFENLTGEATLDWLATGVSHTISGELDRVKGLHIVGSQRVSGALADLRPEERADPQRIGTSLGVDWIVAGSYQLAGSTLRITVRPYRVREAESLPPVTVQGSMDDLFALQDAVVARTAELLRVELERWDQRRMARKTTGNLEAYRALSTAMRSCDRSQWPECFDGLDHAIDIDDQYAWAYVERGIHRYWQSGYGDFDRSLLAGAASDLRRGASLDPDLERYRAYEAVIHAMLGEYGAAERVIDALASSRPDDQMVLLFTGHVFAGSTLVALVLDDLPRGIRAYQQVLETSPGSAWVYVNLSERYLAAGKYDRALEAARDGKRHARDAELPGTTKEHPPVQAVLEGLALDGLGNRDEATAALEEGIASLDHWGAGLYSANLYRWLAHEKLAQIAKKRGDKTAMDAQAAAAAEIEQSLVRQHPLAPGKAYQHVLLELMLLVDRDRAIELVRRDQQAAPDDPLPPLFLSTLWLLDGRYADAKTAAERARSIAHGDPEVVPYIERRIARCERRESLAASLSP